MAVCRDRGSDGVAVGGDWGSNGVQSRDSSAVGGGDNRSNAVGDSGNGGNVVSNGSMDTISIGGGVVLGISLGLSLSLTLAVVVTAKSRAVDSTVQAVDSMVQAIDSTVQDVGVA